MAVEDQVKKIIREEAERNGYTVKELLRPDTSKHVTAVRQYTMWRAWKETGSSFTCLADLFKRAHSTISFGCKLVEAQPGDKRGVIPPRPASPPPEPIKPFVLPIIKEEAARNGYAVDELIAPDHTLHVTAVRQYAMWRARTETGRSLVEIARFFKRDHTTVMHACRKVDGIPEELRGKFPPRQQVQRRVPNPNYNSRFEGKPCQFGHTLRYWSNLSCVACSIERHRRNDAKRRRIFAEAAE